MLAAFVLMLSLWLVASADTLASKTQQLLEIYTNQSRAINSRVMAQALDAYESDNQAIPQSLDDLVAAQGYEFTRGLIEPWQGYLAATGLVDGSWQFDRMVFFSTQPRLGIQAAEYLDDNRCGVGSAEQAASWCGSRSGKWYRFETRNVAPQQVVKQRLRLIRTGQKLAQFFNAYKTFPPIDNYGTQFLPGDSLPIALLANYSLGSKECTGTHMIHAMPLDCGDLFDLWGQPVRYQFESNRKIALVSVSPLRDNTGKPIIIALTHDLSNL